MSFLLVGIVSASLGSVITVDDDGPAQHSSIAAAVLASSPGDVIVVAPGQYSGFSLDKDVTVVGLAGAPRPKVTTLTSVDSIQGFTFAGLEFDLVDVRNVAQRGRIDDCLIRPATNATAFALEIEGCAEIEVSRCEVRGAASPGIAAPTGQTAMRVTGSRVVVLQSELHGGKGGGAFPSYGPGGDGGHGLIVRSGSDVVVTAAMLEGGPSGACFGGLGNCTSDGAAGDAARVNASTLRVVGAAAHLLVGGSYFPDYGGDPGYAIRAIDSTVVAAGVSLQTSCICSSQPPNPVASSGASSVFVTTALPYLTTSGGDTAGQAKSISLFGPAGAPVILFASATTGLSFVPQVGGALWFGIPPLVVLAFTAQGYATPVALSFTLPPSVGIEGVSLGVQAILPSVADPWAPGKAYGTNPAFVIVRP